MSTMNKFRLALIQLAVTANKSENLRRATQFIAEAASKGAHVVALPECCNCPYGNDFFGQYAEEIPGESTDIFSKAASDNKIHLIAGSIPERKDGKLYNTCTIYAPDGSMVATHRKVHLFDIDVPGKITFQESKTLSPGNTFTTFNTPFCKIGVGICYDMRFAEMAQIYAKQDCRLLIYPGAFNMTTGPAHWELLSRARAVDNQLYVSTVSPARDTGAQYIAWGHSTIVNPWGEIVSTCDEKETVIYGDIDLSRLDEVRTMIPLTNQRRQDLYKVTDLTQQ